MQDVLKCMLKIGKACWEHIKRVPLQLERPAFFQSN